MIVAAPKDGNELRDLLFTALAYDRGPFAIRFPKDSAWRYDGEERYNVIPIGSWETLRHGSDICLLAVGSMVKTAFDVAERLDASGITVEVNNCRFVKPLDHDALTRVADTHRMIITLEEANLRGGFGQAVTQWVMERRSQAPAQVHCVAIEDCFVPHGARNILLDWAGLSAPRIEKRIHGWLENPPRETRARVTNADFGMRNAE
jgi:1-deoxy-D-xylulose-5-phosphate synthase